MDSEEKRVAFFKALLEGQGLKVLKTEDLGAHNNFVYLFDLQNPTTEEHLTLHRNNAATKPSTSSIQKGTTKLICRMSNPEANLNEEFRVQNQVATMSLAQSAFKSINRRIVPLIFDWEDTTPDCPGWMINEWMAGSKFEDEEWKGLDVEKRDDVLMQMATIVKALQEFELPFGNFGGVGYDDEGGFVGRAMTIPCGGPFKTYAKLCEGMLEWQLAARDGCSILMQGDEAGLRERLRRFVSEEDGMKKVLSSCDLMRPTITHGDMLRVNFLFDKETLQVSSILDWDLAHIAAPISEYLHGFGDVHGFLGSRYDDDEGFPLLRKSQLTSFPSPLPIAPADFSSETPGASSVNWELAKAWDDSLENVGAAKPSSIAGAAGISDFWWFTQELCPWYFLQERKLEKLGPEKVEHFRKDSETRVDAQLKEWGF